MEQQSTPDAQMIAELKKSIEEQQQKLDELTRASYSYAAPTPEAEPQDLAPEVQSALEHEQTEDKHQTAEEAKARAAALEQDQEFMNYPQKPEPAPSRTGNSKIYNERPPLPHSASSESDNPPQSTQNDQRPEANGRESSMQQSQPDDNGQGVKSKAINLKEKAVKSFESIVASEPLSSSTLNKGSIIFLILGTVFLAIMVASIIFSQSFIWPLFAIIAGLQLTMGAVLLIKS